MSERAQCKSCNAHITSRRSELATARELIATLEARLEHFEAVIAGLGLKS